MDFLNRGFKQIADLFETMTPAARLTTGLLLAVLIVSFVFLFRQEVEGGGEYLFDAAALSGPRISVMEGVFAAAGLEHAVREGYRIRVPAGKKWEYMAALSAADVMPENARTAYEEMFKRSSLLDNRSMMSLKVRIADEENLEQVLSHLNGIHSAEVRIQERDRGGFPRSKVRTAVATVRADGAKHLDRVQINTIREIVAVSSGADRENVTVADSNANLAYRGSGKDGMPLADEDPYAARVQLYEDKIKRSIENLMAPYPGALVEVRAELEPDFVNREDRITYDGQPVTTSRMNSTKLDSSTTNTNGGRPGTASNGVGNSPQQVGSVATIDNKSEETYEQTDAVPGRILTTIHKPPFLPKRVTASIRIPRSLWRTIWLADHLPVDGEDPIEPEAVDLEEIESREIEAIKDTVTALLPEPEPGDDPYPLVTVQPYTATPIDAPTKPGMAANAGSWFADNWQTLALFGAAIFSVFFLKGMVQSKTPPPARAASSSERTPAAAQEGLDEEEMDESDLSNSLRDKGQHTGRSLRDELTELVHEDPDAAANVLANWIGDAA
jgi:flagellar M-ring protein FliF